MRQRIERDEKIIIKRGLEVHGTVLTADNWGTPEEPNWFIEFLDTFGNYRYWKQEHDGGKLIFPKF